MTYDPTCIAGAPRPVPDARHILADGQAGKYGARLLQAAALALDAPAAILAVLHEGREVCKGAFGFDHPGEGMPSTGIVHALASHGGPLAVDHLVRDPRLAGGASAGLDGFKSLLAVPVGSSFD